MADLRETLIRAAAAEVHRAACGCDGSLHSRDEYDCLYRGRAVAALSGALPLVADALKADLPTGRDRLSLGISKGKRRSARLVRSLLGDTDGDR